MINDDAAGATDPGGTTTTAPLTNAHDTAVADVLTFLAACFGDLAGNAHAATGRDPFISATGKYEHHAWRQNHALWPDQGDDLARTLVAASAAGDVYVCPYLMWADKRAPGGAVARMLVHADVDTDVDPQRVRDLGGFAVSSGTRGGAHVYVPLAASIPGKQHQVLARALGKHFGAVDSKIATNDLLRPPGTLNYKPTLWTPAAPPAPVTWLVRPDE